MDYQEILKNNDFNDIDKEILPVVIMLNDLGFETTWSCAGHGRNAKFKRGLISFKETLTNEEKLHIEEIAKHFGLKNLSWYDDTIFFDPIGI